MYDYEYRHNYDELRHDYDCEPRCRIPLPIPGFTDILVMLRSASKYMCVNVLVFVIAKALPATLYIK